MVACCVSDCLFTFFSDVEYYWKIDLFSSVNSDIEPASCARLSGSLVFKVISVHLDLMYIVFMSLNENC